MTTKVQRQATVSRLIGDHEVTNQPQLIQLLSEHGIEATQATVSRDLDDIGAWSHDRGRVYEIDT